MNSSPANAVVWDAALYERRHRFVFEKIKNLIELLDPQPGEWVLDAGCGTGHLTAEIAAVGANVVGVDSSAAMLDRARQNFPDLEFREADLRLLRLDRRFDAVFSNAVLHWLPEAEAVVIGLRRALRDDGRLVLEFGGKGNVSQILQAVGEAGRQLGVELENPWYFPSIPEYTALLERHSFEVVYAELIDRPTQLEDTESGMQDWLRQFGQNFLAELPESQHQRFLDLAAQAARPSLFRDGKWWADYRRLRVGAFKRKGSA